MKIDVVKYSYSSAKSLASVPGITKFKTEYSHWFREPGEMYIRCVGKTFVGTWRYIPIKSTEFYRCPKVTSPDFIAKLNHDFITSVIRVF